MGLQNFTGSNAGGPGGPGGSGMPSMSGFAGGGSVDVEDMLIDYNDRFKSADPTLFREEVIDQTISVLIGKTKPNPLLVGAAGVGKTKIVEDIARRIANGDPSIPPQLRRSKIYELPLSVLVAGAGIVGQLEQRVTELLDWLKDPSNDAILFVDEIHVLVNDRSTTYEKIAQIMKPALARGDIRVIGATTLQESRDFDDDPAFQRRFTRLIVDELDREQTTAILHLARPALVAHYKNQVVISDDVLNRVAAVADKHSKASMYRPDNALTLLDRTMADVLVRHQRAISEAQAAGDTNLVQALQAIPAIPVNEARLVNTAVRMMTGNAVKGRVDFAALAAGMTMLKGQDEILDELTCDLKRDDLGIFPKVKPLVWLFAGTSGAGKTQLAKIIAEHLTGQPPIILNMTEYIHESAMSRIIGAPPGYIGSDSNGELPFDTLESNPYRVILLDEIEKSDKAVQRLFLSALDEGYIKTARGKVIDFSKTLIIATTNAARDSAGKPSIGFGAATQSGQAKLVSELNKWFDAEFLARFSKIVAFNAITKEIYREIIVSSYAREREAIIDDQPRLAARLPISIPDADLERLVNDTFISSQGARPAVRTARQFVEDTLLAAQSAAHQFPVASDIEDDLDEDEQEAPFDDEDEGRSSDDESSPFKDFTSNGQA